jgi:dynein heavy chain
LLQPLFLIDVELSVPSVTINPNLDDVQSAINACALQILKCTQQIVAWQSIIVFDGDDKRTNKTNHSYIVDSNTKFSLDWSGGKSVYERAANDMEMVKTVIILTGSVQTLRNKVSTIVFGNFIFCFLK